MDVWSSKELEWRSAGRVGIGGGVDDDDDVVDDVDGAGLGSGGGVLTA